ncbi:diguanylate cyclase domain-containing protein [Pelomonas sp. BJYL3]|uniref:diguanylate cyclase domain-containing protein n=1 Tax=Pelomonas sp. BJYL3 TaxID=2976697 RepID=UPI0022B2E883|nr:diguanylate cyclase [Pelomonas sp. BJYL3]
MKRLLPLLLALAAGTASAAPGPAPGPALAPVTGPLAAPAPAGAAASSRAELRREALVLTLLAYDRPVEAARSLRPMVQLAQSAGDAPLQAELTLALAAALTSGQGAAEAETLARQLDQDFPGHAQLIRAMVAERQDHPQAASELARKGLELLHPPCLWDRQEAELRESVEAGCDATATWLGLRLLALSQEATGAGASAITVLERHVALARQLKLPGLLALSLGRLAVAEHEQDQVEAGRQHLAQALQAAQGDQPTLARIKVYEGGIAVARKDRSGQLRALEEALSLAHSAGARRVEAVVRSNLADFYLSAKQPERALATARLALPALEEFQDRRMERIVRHNMSLALIQLHQFDAARQERRRLDAMRPELVGAAERSHELEELADAWAESGQWAEALKALIAEREQSLQVQEASRKAQLDELRLRYDSDRKSAELTLLQRDGELKARQVSNSVLAQRVGMALALLTALLLPLLVVMLKKVRLANRQLKANEALLRAQSERDPLTNLANRRHFMAVMEQHAANTFNGALLMVDIDHFKHVNDEHGHSAGDAVICEVSRRISQAVREEDLVVRWGGEEFLVFIPGVPPAQLQQMAERILFAVGGEAVQTPDGPLHVTVSVGFAHFPLPPTGLSLHWEQAVNWADMVLYTAKAQGRNRAIGIATIDAHDTEALTQIQADFDAACISSRVQLLQVLGPTTP